MAHLVGKTEVVFNRATVQAAMQDFVRNLYFDKHFVLGVKNGDGDDRFLIITIQAEEDRLDPALLNAVALAVEPVEMKKPFTSDTAEMCERIASTENKEV